MIDRHQLSSEERNVLEQARVEWAAQAFSTASADRPRAEAAMVAMYGMVGMGPPRFKWVSHPGELIADLPLHHRLVAPSNPLVGRKLGRPMWQVIDAIINKGALMAYWHAVNDMRAVGKPSWSGNMRRLADMLRPWRIRDVGPMRLPNCFVPNLSSSYEFELLEFFARRFGRPYEVLVWPHAELARAGQWTLPRQKTCIMLERPTRISVDDEGQFHCEDGPALAYGKDRQLWAWHGAIVPELAIERPERITMEMLESLPRETAYAIIERLGADRFVRRFGAIKFHVDRTGTLWHRTIRARRETWTWACVQVRNGTPAPDSSFEHFYLTVPANLRTARAAVAWTYGMREREYAVAVRT